MLFSPLWRTKSVKRHLVRNSPRNRLLGVLDWGWERRNPRWLRWSTGALISVSHVLQEPMETYWSVFDTQPVCRGVIWHLEPVRFSFFGHLLCKKGCVCVSSHFTQNGQTKGGEVSTTAGWRGSFLAGTVLLWS